MTFSYRSPGFTTTDRDEYDRLFGFKPMRKARVSKTAKRIPQKSFTPKPGDPGTVVSSGGRSFEVWSAGPHPKSMWAIPLEARDGDAQVYLVSGNYGGAQPYHADGSECRTTTWTEQPSFRRVESPCSHRSHKAVTP